MKMHAFPLAALAVVMLAANGLSQEVKFEKKLLLVCPNEGSDVGDVNNDGHKDIVAGPMWFAGPDWTPRPLRDVGEFDDDFCKNNGDHLWDVDGDGLLDVVSADWHGDCFYWYKNPGGELLEKGLKWEQRLLAQTRGQNEVLYLTDLDGDDAPEIYVSCWIKGDPQVAWKLVKDANGEPTIERKLIGNNGGGHGYAFGDLNGDGLDDILTETGWYERPAGDPWAREWAFHPETALPHPSCPFLVLDLNNDGRNDILWGKAHDYGLYWWEQLTPKTDGTTVWKEHLIDDQWSQAHCLVWADIDRDGQGELIAGKRVRGHAGRDPGGMEPECLFYYEWNPQTLKFTRHTISGFGEGVGTGMQLNVEDLNGDDWPDIAVAGKTGTWVLINQGVK